MIARSGIYPQTWKIARVTPIHKRGSTASPSNYRPISVLPTLSTTFERVLLLQLSRRLLQYIPGRTFKLISSYLSERLFMVVTNGERSECCQIHSGVPQGGIWSPLLFDLFVRKLPQQVQHAAMLCYADDTTLLMRIPTGHRDVCAALLNSDLERLLNYGKSWLLEFEVKKTQALSAGSVILTTTHHLLWMESQSLKD